MKALDCVQDPDRAASSWLARFEHAGDVTSTVFAREQLPGAFPSISLSLPICQTMYDIVPPVLSSLCHFSQILLLTSRLLARTHQRTRKRCQSCSTRRPARASHGKTFQCLLQVCT